MEQMLLLAAARLISYPDENFYEDVEAVTEWLESEAPVSIKETWLPAVTILSNIPLQTLKEIYVDTFDWKKSAGLYLTAQELGDSRGRGAALVKLQKLISEAGFERVEGELADFIPMIYEFLGVAPESPDVEKLKHRAAVATYQINESIDKESPYAIFFALLMEHVFESPTKEGIAKFRNEQEKADTEELPFPLLYD